MGRFACVLLLAGCGARTDVHAYDAGTRDAAIAPPDAFVPRDAFVPPDAGAIACPGAPAIGFRIATLGTIDLGRPVGDVWLGGDGQRVYVLASEREPARALHLYAWTGSEAHELAAVDGFGRVSVANGVARVVALQDNDVIVLEASGEEAHELGRTTVDHGTRLAPERPVWNGSDWVLGGTTGFVGALVLGTESFSWRPTEHTTVRLDADPSTGRTHVLALGSDYAVESYISSGMQVGTVVLAPQPWSGTPAFGWLDDGTDQPLVLAGFTREGDDTRARLQRFALDGTPRGGFSTPIDFGGGGTVDLTTVAIPPHAHGYGMVASAFPTQTLFHGATESFVGDASLLPFVCASPSIAAGPCGYVIACTIDGVVHAALAVPAS